MGRDLAGGFRMGTHVHPWRIHVNVRQNHYNIVLVLPYTDMNPPRVYMCSLAAAAAKSLQSSFLN